MTGLPDRDQLAPGNFSGEIAGHRWRVDVLPFYADFVDPRQTDLDPADRGGAGAVAVRAGPADQHRPPAPEGRPNERASARRRRIAGFTLVEALLATALMGAILAAIATVTAQWLPNWNRGFERVQRVELLALGLERIVADLAAAEFVTAGAASRAAGVRRHRAVGHVPAHRARTEHAARASSSCASPETGGEQAA